MIHTDKRTLGTIVAVILITLAIFVGFSTFLPTLDQNNKIIALLTSFFTAGTTLTVIALIRNIMGFALAWANSSFKEVFADEKLYATLIYYAGIVTLLVSIIPEQYKIWGVVLGTGIDLFIQTVKALWGKNK